MPLLLGSNSINLKHEKRSDTIRYNIFIGHESKQMSRTFRNRFIQIAIFLGIVCSLNFSYSTEAHALENYFDAKVDLDLCPEYTEGGILIDIFYRIGSDPTLIAPQVLTKVVNTTSKTLSATIRLPSTLTTIPLNVVSFCRSFRGFSKESNVASITNCDNLAQYDTDGDGIPNNLEDTNCDNFFSPGDASNPDNVDTDGDGVRDLVEGLSGTDPTNPGSSPRPYIYSSATFDSDSDGVSNPIVWRSSTANWYIKAAEGSTAHQSINFGEIGDLPFTYKDINQISNIGVIRRNGTQLFWYFRGTGFTDNTNTERQALQFGIFGDNIVLGPWDKPNVTTPAVARLFNGVWTFDFLKPDLTVRSITWGVNGDIPKCQDFDGDGLFDVAVFRPNTQKTYVRFSKDNSTAIYNFGSGTADHTVKGDYTGDGKEDISFWEPQAGLFTTLTSTNSFDDIKGKSKDPMHYQELTLGEYVKDLPLNWNTDEDNLNLYTTINHATGTRKFYPKNKSTDPIIKIQWGLAGDFQG